MENHPLRCSLVQTHSGSITHRRGNEHPATLVFLFGVNKFIDLYTLFFFLLSRVLVFMQIQTSGIWQTAEMGKIHSRMK